MTNFQYNIDLIKNARFVWKDVAPEVSPVPGVGEGEEISWNEALEAADFLKYTRDTCDTTKKTGEKILEQSICSLAELDVSKVVRLKIFIDELGEKFLNKLPEIKYHTVKDSVKRLQLLQEVTDMKALVERFKEAKSYEIKPYRRGKNPAMVIFNYSDGKSEEYPLEFSWEEKRKSIWQALKAIQKGVRKRERGQRRKEDEVSQPTYRMEEARETQDQWREKMEDLIARANYLRTPEDVHRELRSIATHLSDELLGKLSTPLSKMTEILSNAEVDYEKTYKINISDEDAEQADLAEEELEKALEDYYSPDSFLESMDDEQLSDILKIIEEFQLD